MSSPRIRPLILLMALSLTACGESNQTGWVGQIDTLSNGAVQVRNPAAPLWDSASAWTLHEELRIGSADAEGPEVFGYLAGLAVDADGRIWVVDRQARELRIFGPDGSHIRTVGRQGEGPGEFQDPIGVEIAPDGRIWVVDAGNARYSIHDATGDFIESRRRMISGYSVPWRGGFEDGGWFWEPGVFRAEESLRSAVLRMDPSLAPRDTVLLPQADDEEVFELTTDGGYMTANVPFTPNLTWERAPDGALWLASTGHYRLHRTVDGDTTRIVEREFDPVPVTDQEKDEAVENLEWFVNQGGQVDRSRIPDTKPILRQFTVDPAGRLWVLVNEAGESEGYPFDVFDPEGRYLGRVRSPIAFDPRTIFRGDEIYGVGSDELGAPQIVKLRVRRPDDAVRYTVRPQPTDSLVRLHVLARFRGEADGTTQFALPSDRFGAGEMHEWITEVRPDSGTRLSAAEPGVYTARHAPGADVFALVERIVCGQREAFDDFDRPFFTVFVTEREGIRAGAPLLHGFTAFLEPDTSPAELRGLLAHEMIHTWLPRTARLVDPARPEAPEAWTRWFHEGFTEYLARIVLVRQEMAPLA